jgi:hypothetical protein
VPVFALAYQFQWSVLWTGQYGRWLLQGLLTTLELSALAWLLAAGLGGLFGALRTTVVPSFAAWPLRKPLDAAPVSADSRPHRATRVAPDVIWNTAQGAET